MYQVYPSVQMVNFYYAPLNIYLREQFLEISITKVKI